MTQTLGDVADGVLGYEQEVNRQLEELEAGAIALLDQLKATREKLLADIRTLDAQIARVEERIGKKTTRKKREAAEPKPSPESVERTVRWLAEQPEPLNADQVAEQLQLGKSSAAKQLRMARDLGLVRVAMLGGTNGRQQHFSVFEGAIEKLDAGEVRWP